MKERYKWNEGWDEETTKVIKNKFLTGTLILAGVGFITILALLLESQWTYEAIKRKRKGKIIYG